MINSIIKGLNNFNLKLFPLLFVILPIINPASAQVKLAQAGFQFLSVGTDARATAMGEAFTTVDGSITCILYNPAGISSINSPFEAEVSQMKWIADIKYISAAAAITPFNGDYGTIGISFLNVDYGNFNFTMVANNDKGYVDLNGYPKPYAFSLGVAYAKELSDRFSVGGSVQFVKQSLGNSLVPVFKQVLRDSVITTDTSYATRNYGLGVMAFNFGTVYKTGLKSLSFGMSINNFSKEIAYERENFQLPLTFKFGISMNLMDLIPEMRKNNSFLVSIDAIHPRAYSEFLNMGAEYGFMNTLFLRAGYITKHDDYAFTFGLGIRKFGLAFDYSFMPEKIFENVHRFSLRFTM
ncbi:MAG: PorV/PorQ family protein [Candidatus Kryptoniota bacterium]